MTYARWRWRPDRAAPISQIGSRRPSGRSVARRAGSPSSSTGTVSATDLPAGSERCASHLAGCAHQAAPGVGPRTRPPAVIRRRDQRRVGFRYDRFVWRAHCRVLAAPSVPRRAADCGECIAPRRGIGVRRPKRRPLDEGVDREYAGEIVLARDAEPELRPGAPSVRRPLLDLAPPPWPVGRRRRICRLLARGGRLTSYCSPPAPPVATIREALDRTGPLGPVVAE